MTFREKLADWISGGVVTEARSRGYNWKAHCIQLDGIMRGRTESLFKSANALRQIAALETPHANATVRKMARIAREAVK